MRDISANTVRTAHEELRDIYVAAITAARNFSKRGKPDQSVEAMGVALDATRMRQVFDDAATRMAES